MISYVKSGISITAKQAASARAFIEKELRAAAWTDGWEDLMVTFDEAFYDALEAMDIEVNAMSPEYKAGQLIVGDEAELMELYKLQRDVWQRRISERCSLDALSSVIGELLDIGFNFLGIKVINATRKSGRAPLRRAA